jgi:hypothetical protein
LIPVQKTKAPERPFRRLRFIQLYVADQRSLLGFSFVTVSSGLSLDYLGLRTFDRDAFDL